MSNNSSDFGFFEQQISNKKERQNEDKINFQKLFFLVDIFRFLPGSITSKSTPVNIEQMNK
jgi:hypothetical protein